MKYFTMALLMLLSATAALAQEGADITGDYRVDGVGGDGSVFTTRHSLANIGGVYQFTFVSSDGPTDSSPALLRGDVLVDAFGGEACGEASYIRQSNGTLVGVWLDLEVGPAAFGVEFLTPQSETEGFAGTYDLVGSYGDGARYEGQVEITEDENQIFTIVFDESFDERVGGPARFAAIGIELEGVLGYTWALPEDIAACGVYVAVYPGDGTSDGLFYNPARSTEALGTLVGRQDE